MVKMQSVDQSMHLSFLVVSGKLPIDLFGNLVSTRYLQLHKQSLFCNCWYLGFIVHSHRLSGHVSLLHGIQKNTTVMNKESLILKQIALFFLCKRVEQTVHCRDCCRSLISAETMNSSWCSLGRVISITLINIFVS